MKKISLYVVVTCLVALAGCKWPCCSHSHDAPTDEIKQATLETKQVEVLTITSDESFEKEVLKSDKPVIVDFSAVWCHACQTMKPVFEDLAKELSGYKFVTINVDAAEKIAHDYNVTGIPMFTFFQQGKEVNKDLRMTGVVSKEDLKKAIEKAFGKSTDAAAPETQAEKQHEEKAEGPADKF